jgi:hypothetical protein
MRGVRGQGSILKGTSLETQRLLTQKQVHAFFFHLQIATELLQDINNSRRALLVLIYVLVAWLHLVCGLSRAPTAQAMKILEAIVFAAVDLGRLANQTEHYPTPKPQTSFNLKLTLPHDVRTAMTILSVEPKIIRSICCSKCFAKYDLDSLPQVCLHRESHRSKVCGEKLWTTRSSQAGPRLVPQRLYSTQDFESWLEFFLSCPGIEELIDKSYTHHPSAEVMHCIWDSPAWRSLGAYTTTPCNLTFSYYIDWFNPLTNKIAGKTISCGAIMMFCLNLPYELQHCIENTYFAGITPGPKEPSVTTITAVSDPIIDQFESMWYGKIIRTHRHPNGIQMRAAVLPSIGDLLAIHKALGFAGIASHHFCSFCDLHRKNIDSLDIGSWKMRVGVEVLAASEQWRRADTKKERKDLFSKYGIR